MPSAGRQEVRDQIVNIAMKSHADGGVDAVEALRPVLHEVIDGILDATVKVIRDTEAKR